MPNLDGTGPEGRGRLTGRRMGKCGDKDSSKKETTEEQDVIWGRGRGGRPRGGGFGFGGGGRWRHGFGRRRGSEGRRASNDESNNNDD